MMTAMNDSLQTLSNQMADVVAAIAPKVVQVQGHRAPVSGVVHSSDAVLTNARALGREDGLRVRKDDGTILSAELQGWDPATGLALLRVSDLGVEPIAIAADPARVGNLALAVARSWSNAVTASIGIVSVIGGPLRTGRGRSIDEVIRTSAPMHDGFAGGAFADMDGRLVGVATATSIRGLGVIIPASIAWKTGHDLQQHGRVRRGFLGIASQPVRLGGRQEEIEGRDQALLVVAVQEDSPAAAAGLLVGDLIVAFDGQPVESPQDLLELLAEDRVGKDVVIRILRGDRATDLTTSVGERPVN
jgi:S1-C subfamily serine protease